MDIDTVMEMLRQQFPEQEFETRSVPLDDTFIAMPPEMVKPVAQALMEQLGIIHLSTITGQDTGEGVELLYHFWHEHGFTLRTLLNYEALSLPTLTDLIPGSTFYELEIAEMLGVTFEGHADPRPLMLPDDWDGGLPLRLQKD